MYSSNCYTLGFPGHGTPEADGDGSLLTGSIREAADEDRLFAGLLRLHQSHLLLSPDYNYLPLLSQSPPSFSHPLSFLSLLFLQQQHRLSSCTPPSPPFPHSSTPILCPCPAPVIRPHPSSRPVSSPSNQVAASGRSLAMNLPVDSPAPKSPKQPIVRGARACTVCRAAKMKCVGAEDGQQPCQRCKRSNTECIFEKHRRGRKPGSKLSEASKMLRRLEKGLSNAKRISQTVDSALANEDPHLSNGDSHIRPGYTNGTGAHPFTSQPSGSSSMDEDENDGEPNEEGMYPAKLITKERQRNSFFGTVLGPSGASRSPDERTFSSVSPTIPDSSSYNPSATSTPHWFSSPFSNVEDPVKKGLLSEREAENILDLVLIRLNPFINLFDPELHSFAYISRRPFLFTTLLMAGTKFFEHKLYPKCRELADLHAIKAFAEQEKSVEVVQAFMCLTYWREPDDQRTWTYIGYACRMAVELGLNRYTPIPPESETHLQRLGRRNRERAYLVLHVHDRSLAIQTGRLWMLPEDEIVIESYNWHKQVPQGVAIRPEDVILAAFVSLRLIATESVRMFSLQKNAPNNVQPENIEFLLNACNTRLQNWQATWSLEMKRANGEQFHQSFLEFFQTYFSLVLNSFGIHTYAANTTGGPPPSLQALSTCYRNATRCLEIIVKDFSRVQMLQYSQESVTTMTAYCAIMLLRLLRKSNLKTDESSSTVVLSLIRSTADAYKDAGAMMPSSSSCASHARFLRTLVEREESRGSVRNSELHTPIRIDPRLQHGPVSDYPSYGTIPNGANGAAGAPPGPMQVNSPDVDYPYGQYAPAMLPTNEKGSHDVYPEQFPTSQEDAVYYENMCRELGVTRGVDLITNASPPNYYPRVPDPQYPMMGH